MRCSFFLFALSCSEYGAAQLVVKSSDHVQNFGFHAEALEHFGDPLVTTTTQQPTPLPRAVRPAEAKEVLSKADAALKAPARVSDAWQEHVDDKQDWHKWLTTTAVPSQAKAKLPARGQSANSKDPSDWRRWAGWKPATATGGSINLKAAREVRAAAAAESKVKDHTSHRVSQWEQHKRHEAIDSEVDALKHAEASLGFMEERAASKLQADMDEVDHIIVRRHFLTDRSRENEEDVQAVEQRTSALKVASTAAAKSGNVKEAKAMDDEVAELELASASIRGSQSELYSLNAAINATTADGKRMDLEVHKLSRERAAISRQVRALSLEGDNLEERAETASDLEAFAKAGYEDTSDPDDPYVQEATHALEQATGWEGGKLDRQAAESREAMTKGLAGDPGQAVQALKSLGGLR